MIIIQARTTSTRFPNKVLSMVNGKKLIDYSIDSAILSGIPFVVAIPEHDTKLMDYLEFRRIPYYCGSEEDVLEQLELYKKRKKFTYGNGVFILSFKELFYAWRNAKGSHREHVTTYLYNCVDYPSDLERAPITNY